MVILFNKKYVKRHKYSLFLLCLLVLGIILRLYGLARQSIWYDEAFTIAYSGKFSWSWKFLSAEITSDPPFLPFLVHYWHGLGRVFGFIPGTFLFDFLLRLLPFSFATVSVLLTYHLCKLILDDRKTSLLATLLCAVSPFQLFYAQELKPYSLYLMLVLIAAIYHLQALKSDHKCHWIMFAIFESLSMYAHFIAVWNIVLFNAHAVWVQIRDHRINWRWFCSQVFMSILCLPVVLMAININAVYTKITNIYNPHPTIKHAIITFKTFFAGYSSSTGVYHLLFIIAAGVFIYACWHLRKATNTLTVLLYYACFPILGNVIFWQTRTFPIYEHRLFIACSIYCYIIIAYGLARFPMWLRCCLVSLFLLLTAITMNDYYLQRLHPMQSHRMGVRYKVDNRGAAAFISSNIAEKDIIVHGSHFTYYPFLYYLTQENVEQFFVYVDQGCYEGTIASYPNVALWETYGALPVHIENAVKSSGRIWLILSWWEPNEVPEPLINLHNWLNNRFTALGHYRFDGLDVILFNAPLSVSTHYTGLEMCMEHNQMTRFFRE